MNLGLGIAEFTRLVEKSLNQLIIIVAERLRTISHGKIGYIVDIGRPARKRERAAGYSDPEVLLRYPPTSLSKTVPPNSLYRKYQPIIHVFNQTATIHKPTHIKKIAISKMPLIVYALVEISHARSFQPVKRKGKIWPYMDMGSALPTEWWPARAKTCSMLMECICVVERNVALLSHIVIVIKSYRSIQKENLESLNRLVCRSRSLSAEGSRKSDRQPAHSDLWRWF